MSEDDLLDALDAHLDRLGAPPAIRQVEVGQRRIDAVAVIGRWRLGVEAKTSRRDYRADSDDKRSPTRAAMHGCVYLMPPGVVPLRPPSGWGVWEVAADGVTERSPVCWRATEPAAADALATALAARGGLVEHRVRHSAPGHEGAYWRREADRLAALVSSRDAAVARERDRARHAASQVQATLGEQPCDTCGSPLRYAHTGWRHVRATLGRACDAERARLQQIAREALTGSAYLLGPPPPPLPRTIVSTER